MPTIDGAAAATTLLNYAPLSKTGACLYYVWLAYKAHGATSSTTYPTAYSAWQATKRRHTDMNPPAGAAVWLGRRTSDGNLAGDVCISVGGGRVACTDWPVWGGVGVATIAQRIAQTGRQYLGWSEDFLGNTVVTLGSTTGGGTVTPLNAWDAKAKQTFLVSIGLDTGGIDGVFGAKSVAATKTFQGWVGLTADGDFGPATIGKAETVIGGRNASTRPTKNIQTFLKVTADGVWGNKTSLAALRYQRSVGLTADAIWGAATDAKAFPPAAPAPTGSPVVGKNSTTRPTADVQTFLKAKGYYTGAIDGDYGAGTTAAVILYQKAQFIDADGVWGITSDGLAFPPAGSIFGVDYSMARPDPATLASRGVKLVGRYLWPASYNTKGITRAEYDALRAHGIDVFFIYEETGSELLAGHDAGVRVATAAESLLAELGLENLPVYFNADLNVTPEQVTAILAALDGIASVIGVERAGLYGGLAAIKAAFDADKIRWGFQTYAWSAGVWDDRAQLRQWSNGQWGDTVDFTRAMVAEYGQHPVPATPPPPDPIPDPAATVTVPRVALQAVVDQLTALMNGAA